MTIRSALAATAAICLATAAAAQEPITLRIQHFVSPTDPTARLFMVPWAEKLEADSGGRLNVEVYPAMQLGGKAPALYDQIRDGVIDGGWALPAYTPGRFPAAEAFELPFMTLRSAEASSRAAWEFTEKNLRDGAFGDIHVCAVHTHGPGIVHTKGAPLEAVADFQGLKLRGPSRQANALLESVGAQPVGMPVPAFPEALSKGVVDGGVIPWQIVPTLKVEELAPNHTDIGGDRSLYNTFFIWGLNKARYEGLPDDLRAVIDANCGEETSAWAGRAFDEGDAEALEIIRARGNPIGELAEAERAKLREIGAAQTAAWIEEMDALGLDGRALVDDARAAIERQSGAGG